MLVRLPASARGVRRPFGRRLGGCVRSRTPPLLYCPHAPGGSRSPRTVCLRGPLIPLQRRPRTDRERQCGGGAAEPTDAGEALLLLLLSARARVSCAGGVCPSRVWEGRRAEACWSGVRMGRLAVLGGHPALCVLNQTGGHFEPQALKTPSHACWRCRVELWGQASGSVRSRAAPSGWLQAARQIASGMAGDGGVKRRAAPSLLQATQAIARRMVEDDGVKRRAVPRQLLQEARHTV